MRIARFCEVYKTSEHNLYSTRKSYGLPKWVISKGRVNTEYFLRRHRFKARIIDEAHLLYYYLNKYFTDRTLAYLLTKCTDKKIGLWTSFISCDLFALDNGSITKYKVKSSLWLFYRKARALVRYCFGKFGLKYSPEKLEKLILNNKGD